MKRMSLLPLVIAAAITTAACGPAAAESAPAAPPAAPLTPPTASPTATKTPAPPTATKATPATGLPGTLIMYELERAAPGRDTLTGVNVLVIADGRLRRTAIVGTEADTSQSCVAPSIVASPDGKRLAWVAGDCRNDLVGELTIANLNGSGRRTLTPDVYMYSTWLYATGELLMQRLPREHFAVNIHTGTTRPVSVEAGPAGYATSPTGAYRAYKDSHQRLVVARADGTVVHRSTYTFVHPCPCSYLVDGVSADGRYVSVKAAGTDPGIGRDGERLVDAATGREVAMPAGSERILQFLANGGMVVRKGNTIMVVSAAGTVTASTLVPRLSGFLTYAP